MDATQRLLPGWRLEAFCPSPTRRDCCLRLTTPNGTEIQFTHSPTTLARDFTKSLAMALTIPLGESTSGSFRIARPDQLGAKPYPSQRR